MCLVCSEHSLRAQTTDSNGSMQRACLPPADYKTTTLPPRSSSRQHLGRLAGPRCAMPSCIGSCNRSPDSNHQPLSTACCARSYHTSTGPPRACRQQLTTAARTCGGHAHPQLTAKRPPCRPAAAAGGTMRVWQVRALSYR